MAIGLNQTTNDTALISEKFDILEQNVDSMNEKIDTLDQNMQNEFNKLSLQQEENSQSNNFNAFLSLLAAVAVPLFIYGLSQYIGKRSLLQRAPKAILRELKENEEALTGKKGFDVIQYTSEKEDKSGNKIKVKYTNGLLDADAYDSVVKSGQFTHLKVETQNILTAIYTRIKDHNETNRYTNEFEDQFFMNDDSEARKNAWYKAVERYDIVLTKWEQEILERLPKAKLLLEKETKFLGFQWLSSVSFFACLFSGASYVFSM